MAHRKRERAAPGLARRRDQLRLPTWCGLASCIGSAPAASSWSRSPRGIPIPTSSCTCLMPTPGSLATSSRRPADRCSVRGATRWSFPAACGGCSPRSSTADTIVPGHGPLVDRGFAVAQLADITDLAARLRALHQSKATQHEASRRYKPFDRCGWTGWNGCRAGLLELGWPARAERGHARISVTIASRTYRRGRPSGRGARVAVREHQAANLCRTWPMGRSAVCGSTGHHASHARTPDPGRSVRAPDHLGPPTRGRGRRHDVARHVLEQAQRGKVVLDRVSAGVQVEHRNQDIRKHVAGDEIPASSINSAAWPGACA